MNTATLAASILCISTTAFAAQDGPNTFGASVLVNMDLGGIPPGDLSVDSFPAGLGDAKLDLSWKASKELAANIVLLGNKGTVQLDQAWGSIDEDYARFDFGLFTLPHGIHEGRLIHGPLLQDHVESILPGASAVAKLGAFSPSLSLSSRKREIEPIEEDSAPGTRREAVATAALDWSFAKDGLVRASSQFSSDRRDVALAATLPVGPVVLDLEAAAGSGSARTFDAGFLAGAALHVTETVQIAVRGDGVAIDDEWTKVVAGGVSWNPVKGATVAAEWLQDLDGDGTLTLRLGVELGWTTAD